MTVQEFIEREIPLLPGWCTIEKGKRMADLCRGASLCVELGVFGARSLIAMGAALRDQGSGRAVGIDPYTTSAALEGVNAVANDEWWAKLDLPAIGRGAEEAISRLGLSEYVQIMVSHSHEAVSRFENDSIDVLHQDSNHSEEISCSEVRLWTPKMRSGGRWILDDADWDSTKAAQMKLVDLGFVEIEDHGGWKVYLCP